MANSFEWALQQMREGKKVTCDLNGFCVTLEIKHSDFYCGDYQYNISGHQILKGDWQLYE